MYSLYIRLAKGNDVLDYYYCHESLDIFYCDSLYDVTLGADRMKIRSFKSKATEENLQKLAQYLIESEYRVTRVKPGNEDWTLAKSLISELHNTRISRSFR